MGGFVVLGTLFAPLSGYMMPEYKFCAILVWIVALIAAATLLIGNLGAINQNNAKRLLGYSSIGQAGFILVFFLGVGAYGINAREYNVYTYLLAYALATIPAFYAIAMVRTQRGSEEISAFRGLAKTNPAPHSSSPSPLHPSQACPSPSASSPSSRHSSPSSAPWMSSAASPGCSSS